MSFIPNSYPIGVMICYNDLIYRLITVLGGVPVHTAKKIRKIKQSPEYQ